MNGSIREEYEGAKFHDFFTKFGEAKSPAQVSSVCPDLSPVRRHQHLPGIPVNSVSFFFNYTQWFRIFLVSGFRPGNSICTLLYRVISFRVTLPALQYHIFLVPLSAVHKRSYCSFRLRLRINFSISLDMWDLVTQNVRVKMGRSDSARCRPRCLRNTVLLDRGRRVLIVLW